MFIEPSLGTSSPYQQAGWIEVIAGCMFSGKTEELIRRLNRAIIAKQHVEIFKPSVDIRFKSDDIVSHDNKSISSTVVEKAEDIVSLAGACNVIGVDEAQFFDEQIVDICVQLANSGKRVIVAGLDMDYEGKPFGPMPYLLAVAEYVTKLHAICAVSGAPASFSFRLSATKDRLMLGAKDAYEARSRYYFYKGMQEKAATAEVSSAHKKKS